MQTSNTNKNFDNIIYVGFDNIDISDKKIGNITNGSLMTAAFTPIILNPVQISETIDMISKEQTVIKLMLDSSFRVLNSECISDDDKIINSILNDNKVSGIYPGAFSCYQKEILRLSEADVFFLVDNAIQHLNNININALANDNNQAIKLEWEYAFDFCLANLSRFGVEQKFNFITKRMEQTDSFNAWYQWWFEYFRDIMMDPDLSILLYDKRKTCQDLSMFKPNGSFQDYLSKQNYIKNKTKSI